jgi:hypothetical protein
MQLQKFVTDVIEGIGGIVDPVEYALCQVLIPENYKNYFQNKTELELSFDFEVAQENPHSEFVTFGSYVLEQVLAIANQKAVTTNRFAEIERLTLANPLKKIKEALKEDDRKIIITNERSVLGVWAVFQFHIAYVADEKVEKVNQVWINLLTDEVSETMKQEQNRIVYHEEPIYTYPVPGDIHITDAFKTAYQFVKLEAENENKLRTQDKQMEKDLERIDSYYKELLAENDKKAARKGLSIEKKKETLDKAKAIELERDKQLQEIVSKYNGKIEITLDHGLLYFIPLLQYNIEIQHRLDKKMRTLYYNPITKEINMVTPRSL